MCPSAEVAPPPDARSFTASFDVVAGGASFRRSPAPSAAPPCAVCGAPVGARPASSRSPGAGPPPAAVCGVACRQQLAAMPAWRRCAVCGGPLPADAWAVGACADAACREEHLVARPARERAGRRAALLADAAARRDRAAAAAWPGLAADDVPTAVVPGLDVTTFPLTVAPRDEAVVERVPRRRRRALARHLRTMTARALDDEASPDPASAAPVPSAPAVSAPSAPPTADEARLLGGACGACGGRCCRQGADHGYLSAAVLGGYLDAHPGAGVPQVVNAYLARVPAATVRGSCIFHGPDGCGLPRDMRSDVCNRYFCEGLVELRRELGRRTDAGRPARGAFVAVVDEGRVARGALVALDA